jgi:4-hydroxybenzoate polyprenyltransferase
MADFGWISRMTWLIQSLRPFQWIKKGFILIPLLFARKLFHYSSMLLNLEAVAVFCLIAGTTYVFNDLMDLESDKSHPLKRHRTLAAGLISPRLAGWAASFLLNFGFLCHKISRDIEGCWQRQRPTMSISQW